MDTTMYSRNFLYSTDLDDIQKRVIIRGRNIHKHEVVIVRKTAILNALYALVIAITAFFILNFFVKNVVVSGFSMYPTLNDRDILITLKTRDYQRYDIISFTSGDTTYVKRVVGLPGECVWIDPLGRLFVDGNLMTDDVYGNEPMIETGVATTPVTLAQNEYFVLGDNRNASEDSRFEKIGFVTEDEIIGKMILKF